MIFDAHTVSASFAAAGWGLLLLSIAWAFRTIWTPAAGGALGWKWWTLVAATMLCFRWPLFGVAHALNPDESQLIAGAITLRHDPVFWRSVDGGTAGPLDYYPLLPVTWADGFGSYVMARLIALAVALGGLCFVGEALALLAGAAVARLAVLPALAAMAFTTDPDFAHYSTELIPLLLLAAAGYIALRRRRRPAAGQLWLLGVILGCIVWTKLQAVPLAAGLGALIGLGEYRAGRARSLLPLFMGALVPAVVCFGMITIAAQTEHMVVTYFLNNFRYVGAPQLSWGESIMGQWQNALTDGYLGFWLAGALLVLVPLGLGAVRGAAPEDRRMAVAGLGLLALAVFTALAPRRVTAHHLLFIVLPLTWITGVILALAWRRGAAPAGSRTRVVLATVLLSGTLLPQMALRAAGYHPFAAMNAATDKPTRRELVALVRRFSDPGEPLAIWGWRCGLYVEANRRQATRQAQTEAQIYPSALQPYFLRRYLEDFTAANPPVFADAVGPGNFGYVNRTQAHESFPPLRAWVREHYTQIAELDGTRLYVRNDRLAARRPPPPVNPRS